MHYYLLYMSLGYAGTDETMLVESEQELSQEEMEDWGSAEWHQHLQSSGAVFEPDVQAAVEAGEITEEEMEEELDNALHGMVVYDEDHGMTKITKDNFDEMMDDFRGKTFDYSEEKEEEIRKAVFGK